METQDVRVEIARAADQQLVHAFGPCDRPGRRGARTLDLTSRPDRAAENRLCERLGFWPRQATGYRVPLRG
ncbi:hypothetical protein AB0H86_30060 [Streptomyces sp. NPDC050997]|uniref:hypothetical protein n=1 Tax=Streptomyces sp. NPDC050997 TaxID=3155519 RepID=UPI003419FF74